MKVQGKTLKERKGKKCMKNKMKFLKSAFFKNTPVRRTYARWNCTIYTPVLRVINPLALSAPLRLSNFFV